MSRKYKSIRDVAQDAINLQDASNLPGVALTFGSMLLFLNQNEIYGENRVAIMQCVIYKMSALAFRVEPMSDHGQLWSKAYEVVKSLAAGENIKTEEDFKNEWPRLLDVKWDHMAMVIEFARKKGIVSKLFEQFDYLNGYSGTNSKGCRLLQDRFTPWSWDILMLDAAGSTWFNGGLIYFGPGETGVGGPQFSVRIGSTDEGWSVHT